MFLPVNLFYTTEHLVLITIGRQDNYVGKTDFAQKNLNE